ncbi:MAG: zf-HC2 domain-containing protein [Verrucomicrobiota bacterium]
MRFFHQFKWLIERALHLGGYGCSDTEHLLFAYIEGGLTDEARRKLDKHLANCSACVRYVRSYRQTIELTQEHGLPEIEMPLELQSRLRDFIQKNPELR